jgi:UDPglucose--hexose-1-phosphate uridylyltransferase
MEKKSFIKPDGRNLHLYSQTKISGDFKILNPVGPTEINPHRRWHPLRQEWVIYASHRQNRTFLPPKNYSPLNPSDDENFPTELPIGNYDVAVFDNLFPSMTQNPSAKSNHTIPSDGSCEVIVFTQDPDSSLGNLSVSHIDLILEVLAERTKEIQKNLNIKYVMPFENRGIEMGVTLHHPHGQIYSYTFIPPVQERIFDSMKKYWTENATGLMEQIIQDEKEDGRRIIFETENIICFIPVFARYPYETWIVPKRRVNYLFEMSQEEMFDLSMVLKSLLMKYDHLWERPFPYLMIFNQAPVNGDYPYTHFFIQITPPLRTKDRLKYLAGTELGAGIFVNDSLPEEKAAELKEVKVEVSHE